DQWIESSHIFRILAIAGFILPVAQSRGLVMISTGQTKRLLYMSLFLASVTILGFFIGVQWGTTGVAWSLSITTYLLLLPTLSYAFKNSPVKLSHFLNEIALPAMHALSTGAVLFFLKMLITDFLSPL